MPGYSYLSASIGSRSAAFLAGYQPKKIPVTVQTANESITLHGWMKTGQRAMNLTPRLAPKPVRTPMIPPVMLMMTASFGGYELIMDAYDVALKEGYKFGAYGDAMLIL